MCETIGGTIEKLGIMKAVEQWIENEWLIADRVLGIKDTTKLPRGFQPTDVYFDIDGDDMLLLCFLPEMYQKVMILFDGKEDE